MKKQLRILLMINSFFVLAVTLFSSLYAVYIQKIESAAYHISGIWSFYILSVGILSLIISKYENHKEYTDYFLIGGFLFRAIGWFGYIFADKLIHLYVIQLLFAIGEACGTPAFNFIYSNHLTKGQAGSDWGKNAALNAFVMAIGSFSGGIIVHNFGFNVLFYIMITLAFISSGIALYYKKELM